MRSIAPSASVPGLFMARPVFSLMLPFSSRARPLIWFRVLRFMAQVSTGVRRENWGVHRTRRCLNIADAHGVGEGCNFVAGGDEFLSDVALVPGFDDGLHNGGI